MRPVDELESGEATILDFNVENGEHLESDRGACIVVCRCKLHSRYLSVARSNDMPVGMHAKLHT